LDYSFSTGGKGDKDVKKESKKTIAAILDFLKKKAFAFCISETSLKHRSNDITNVSRLKFRRQRKKKQL
jgi:hypothetical protein